MQEYASASFVDQFVTRFLLRETLNQLTAIEKPLDLASDALEQSALAERYASHTSFITVCAECLDVLGILHFNTRTRAVVGS